MTSQLKNGPPILTGNAACHAQSHPHLDRFCCWTPQNGYTTHPRVYNRTIVRLTNGSHYWTLNAFIAKANELRVPVPLAVPEPTIPANPTAGMIIINKHGANMKFRADNKWQCTNCGHCFLHSSTMNRQQLELDHKGFGSTGGYQCAKKI